VRAALLTFLGCIGICLVGCTTAPSLQEDGIAISDIVQRVKCEIALAVPEPRPPFPTGPYQWMKAWTAKVDLTLNVNEQATINPTFSFIRPMTPDTLPGIGTFQRMFNLGAGAGVSGTATRTEIVSFTVSMQELRDRKYRGDCEAPTGADLYGNLGLKEWMTSALAPVDNKQLRIGHHPPPGSKQPKAEPAPPKGAGAQAWVVVQAAEAERLANELKGLVADAKSKADAVEKKAQASAITPEAIQGAANAVQLALDKFAEVRQKIDYVKKLLDDRTLLDRPNDEERKYVQNTIQAVEAILNQAQTDIAAVWEKIPSDPPLDSISHKVEFIVARSANVTPSWTLVHFKGPGITGNFAAIQRTDTHTLTIAFGAPGEQSRQLGNQLINSLRDAFRAGAPLQ